ncbi:MAG: hypothetical protein AAGI68_11275, partial [Planctomycetota bacterium]
MTPPHPPIPLTPSSHATKRQVRLRPARLLAERVRDTLAPACQRIEIAGSIRRDRPVVGDIELVAIPKPAGSLFTAAESLDQLIDRLIRSGHLAPVKRGPRFQQHQLVRSGMTLDLFVTDPDRWGVIFAIRTGPAAFSKSLVTNAAHGGRLDDDYMIHDGRVWHAESVFKGMIDATDRRGPFFQATSPPLDTPEERD